MVISPSFHRNGIATGRLSGLAVKATIAAADYKRSVAVLIPLRSRPAVKRVKGCDYCFAEKVVVCAE